MSFNIPGYFLDQKTKKLFKITSHGPFSLKELQKRLKAEEEQEAAEAASSRGLNTCHASAKQRSPINITQFLRQRATLGSINNPLLNNGATHNQSGIPFLMTQLKYRTKVELEGPKRIYDNMLVDLTSDPDYGEIIMSHRSGKLVRFGYQVNPGFQVWKAGSDWSTESSDALSLQLGKYNFMLNGQERRTIVGTSGGNLWRHSVPILPPLQRDDLSQRFINADGSIRDDTNITPTPIVSYLDYTEPSFDSLFTKKKDLFWSSSIYDEYDHVVVGGDQALYQLSSSFELVSSRKINSSIFTTHLPTDQPNTCWTGSRNGLIQCMDFRQNNINLFPKFKQSSSVVKIQTSTAFELLTMGMDGSVDIWDIRQPTNNSNHHHGRGNYRGDHQQQTTSFPNPIRKLKGHVNESSSNLGFDIDLENNLLMLAGSDGFVRIWSIFSSNSNEPIWCSEKFSSPVPAAKFIVNQNQHPRIQDGWTSLVKDPALSRQCPGIILFGANYEDNDASSIQWLNTIK
jgi:hypothetical protein